jgi:hypothetical protein
MKTLAISVLAIAACTKQNTPSGGSTDARITQLTLLMKNDINPAFSKLTFLVFHGDSMQEEPQRLRSELSTSATLLRSAMGQLRTWKEPPTSTEQGRDVFYTYANSVDESAQRLLDAIARNDTNTAARHMKQIANTCNSCHHFFRLTIEDSVVPDEP